MTKDSLGSFIFCFFLFYCYLLTIVMLIPALPVTWLIEIYLDVDFSPHSGELGRIEDSNAVYCVAFYMSMTVFVVKYIRYFFFNPFYKNAQDYLTTAGNILLEKYRQQIQATTTDPNISLSKVYALYGNEILSDNKFEGLAEFFNTQLIFNRQSTCPLDRKHPDGDSYDFDNDYDTSSDSSCSSDSGCSGGCGGD
ncbi:hypothetical protein CRENPOLYSF2_3610001 [Crenothrix polyspora]|uniref:Uncharacterized protein n=1 Tax=Crenothrix polyspora TaxID=360316 RepID=A0A1R4HC08_9GAMM|nr:hypothetical protein [Crenothrix polyspora]SJM93788.1 hypothetical protein CRENPOLYSF2_3610001 [Crenothrix polyspora]